MGAPYSVKIFWFDESFIVVSSCKSETQNRVVFFLFVKSLYAKLFANTILFSEQNKL